jgi:hypothetical protein
MPTKENIAITEIKPSFLFDFKYRNAIKNSNAENIS